MSGLPVLLGLRIAWGQRALHTARPSARRRGGPGPQPTGAVRHA